MEGIIFDLKNFRANQLNGMSQQEFANQIDISQDKVSRMESNPDQISLDILIRIATHFGMSLDELIKLPKPPVKALRVDYTWGSAAFIRRSLMEYIAGNPVSETYRGDIDRFKTLVAKTLRKPKVAFIGRSDTGKSTIINTLLGASHMPARWTPTTAIAVCIKHTSDRPAYMTEDVWIFRSDPAAGEVWDDTRLDDEAYCRALRLDSGNYDLLNSYGTRGGEHFRESQATAAVVFLDSSLLLDCDIVDLPGYGTGDRVEDDELSLREKNKADVLIYLSIANGFMRSEDIAYIREAIPALADFPADGEAALPPLGNLFIVASQAHVIEGGDRDALDTILHDGCARFERSLTEGFWADRRKPDRLLDRFYYYTSNNHALCERFEQDLRTVIESLPLIVEQKAQEVIAKWTEREQDTLNAALAEYQKLLNDRLSYEKALHTYARSEPQRHAAFQNARFKVTEMIEQYHRETKEMIDDYYRETISENDLVELMEKRDIKKQKGDIQIFGTYVSGLLEDRVNASLKEKSDLISADIRDFLNDFYVNEEISPDESTTFDKQQIFAASLADLESRRGALQNWIATYSKRADYIMVTRDVGLLAALGVSVKNMTRPFAWLGVMLETFVSNVLGSSVFSGEWKKSTSKKIVKTLKEEHTLDDLKSSIDTYWADTRTAFDKAADNLEQEWAAHIGKLREMVQSYNETAIRQAQSEAEQMRDFLRNLPY